MKDLDRDLIAVQLWLRTQPGGEALHLMVQRHVPRSDDRQIAYILLFGPGDDLVRRRLWGEVHRVLPAWGWHIHLEAGRAVYGVYPDTKHLTAHDHAEALMRVRAALDRNGS